MEMINEIVTLLQKSKSALSESDIAKYLQLRGGARKRLGADLHELVLAGDIVRIRDNRYSLGTMTDLVTGSVTVVRSGNGFVATKDGKDDVFVQQRNLGTALPGDIVTVRLSRERGREDRRSGKVVSIIERKRHDIVGTLKSTGKLRYVVPLNPSYGKDFYVTGGIKAALGDRVVVRFTGWENTHVSPEGELIETLGPAENPSLDTLAIMRHYDLTDEFPPEVLNEASLASGLMQKRGKRLDIRDQFVLTIDPDTAKDFDDALSLDVDKDGNQVVGVHIADVAHFVKAGSLLDKEAMRRGNSVYLADKTVPMLPVQLSNGVCSLKPNEDRLAFSAFLTVDKSGRVIASSFAKTIIRSKLRLTYKEAMGVISGKAPLTGDVAVEGMALIKKLDRLSQQLRKKRFGKWALDLDMPEVELILAEDGTVKGTQVLENDASHQLIEEWMIAANEAVGAELKSLNVPLISRLHEPPADTKIADLASELHSMGYDPGDVSQRSVLATFLKSVKDDPLVKVIRVAVLRSMSRAVYSASASGHYGLAKKSYSHFTSPIRRYPDLAVHRQLASVLAGRGKPPYNRSTLDSVALACTETERNADEAERGLIEMKIYRMLAAEIKSGQPVTHDAIIVKVLNRGMYVELDGFQVQGLVPVSMISDSYVRYDEAKGILRDGRTVYKAGLAIKVIVASVDMDGRRLDFAIEGVSAKKVDRKQGNKSSGNRRSGKEGGGKRGPGKKASDKGGKGKGAPRKKRYGPQAKRGRGRRKKQG